MKRKNIVLIGMPGAGKSTIGVLLAKTLAMAFIDTDLVIQQREKRRLQDLIDEGGVEAFLAAEERAVLELHAENTVIATGGSIVYSQASMNHLKKEGILVYLETEYDEIVKRIKNITTRGIAMNKEQTLYDIYAERIPLYAKYADAVIECTGMHQEVVVAAVVDTLKKFCRKDISYYELLTDK